MVAWTLTQFLLLLRVIINVYVLFNICNLVCNVFRLIKLNAISNTCIIFVLGNLRVTLSFNRPPETDLTLMMFAETTCKLEVPKTGKIKLSYVPK